MNESICNSSASYVSKNGKLAAGFCMVTAAGGVTATEF